MEKPDLASYLSEYILKPDAMGSFFLTLTDLEIRAFEAALDGYFPIDDEDIFDAFLDGATVPLMRMTKFIFRRMYLHPTPP